MSSGETARVLSIQSHVVRGYVGNKSAIFPLQLLGFEVDFMNVVQFSNCPRYRNGSTGQELDGDDLLELYDGLKKNNLHSQYTHILSGYSRSASVTQALYQVIKDVKLANSKTIYLCDPVLGDNGVQYMPAEMVSIFRDKLLSLADVITPNQFEAQVLTEVIIKDRQTVLEAIDRLHEKGPKIVVITSIENLEPNELVTIVSSYFKEKRELYWMKYERLDANFGGTGDLFASLFLAWFTKTNFDLKTTIENVVNTVQAVLKRTYEFASHQPETFQNPINIELRIVQSKKDIEFPNVTNFATSI